MSRHSRPPGFDMTYRPSRRWRRPPVSARIPRSRTSPSRWPWSSSCWWAPLRRAARGSFAYVVEADAQRFSVRALLPRSFCSGRGLRDPRAHARRGRASEAWKRADSLGVGWPRVRKFAWPQIDGLSERRRDDRLELWDGRREWLPVVSGGRACGHAGARGHAPRDSHHRRTGMIDRSSARATNALLPPRAIDSPARAA